MWSRRAALAAALLAAGGAHRLDLGVIGADALDRAHADRPATVAQDQEADGGIDLKKIAPKKRVY